MKHTQIRIVMLAAVSLIGGTLLLKNLELAEPLVHSWVQSMGGNIDTATYNVVLNNYANSFQVLGGIIFGVGFFFFIYSLFFTKK